MSNYLIAAANENVVPTGNVSDKYEEVESDDDGDSILPEIQHTIFKNNKSSNNIATSSNSNTTTSVLPNCPDVTVIKKEKLESLVGGKVNNNSDHSSNSTQSNNSEEMQK